MIADRDHLEQVLDNLVTNAIKFSPDGRHDPRLGCATAGDDVVLSVQDPGVGIPPDQLEAVFGLFYQAEDPVSRRTGGMGLGPVHLQRDRHPPRRPHLGRERAEPRQHLQLLAPRSRAAQLTRRAAPHCPTAAATRDVRRAATQG